MRWLGLGSWQAYEALPVSVRAVAVELIEDEAREAQRRLAEMKAKR